MRSVVLEGTRCKQDDLEIRMLPRGAKETLADLSEQQVDTLGGGVAHHEANAGVADGTYGSEQIHGLEAVVRQATWTKAFSYLRTAAPTSRWTGSPLVALKRQSMQRGRYRGSRLGA